MNHMSDIFFTVVSLSNVLNRFGAEIGIFRNVQVTAIAADALTPGITRVQKAMVLIIQEELVLTFIRKNFYHNREKIENGKIHFSKFSLKKSTH